MTEAEWLACDDPRPMLDSPYLPCSERKLWLFACACCRRIWHLLTDERSRKAIDLRERQVDGLATTEEVEAAVQAARAAREEACAAFDSDPAFPASLRPDSAINRRRPEAASAWAARAAVAAATSGVAWGYAADAASCVAREGRKEGYAGERAAQCVLLRDIVGPHPFRLVTLNPAWLSWNSGTVPKLAQAIYDDRAFDRLPVLADALEDAGCTDPGILGHCRQGGGHVRECWAVDLLLGKE